MTRDDAITLVDYHYWARDRMLDAVEALTPEQYTKDLASSFTRFARPSCTCTAPNGTGTCDGWATHRRASPTRRRFQTSPTIRAAWRSQEQKVRLLVDSLASADQLDRVLRYRTFDGQEMESAFSQMLQHVVNHATYHRGQVTTMLSQLGAPAPKPQDLIRFFIGNSATRVH